jgi:hypothetical protein
MFLWMEAMVIFLLWKCAVTAGSSRHCEERSDEDSMGVDSGQV